MQLTPDASQAAVKKNYRRLVLARHPDKPGGSTEGFLELEAAWDTLGDEEKRAEYDQKIGALAKELSCWP